MDDAVSKCTAEYEAQAAALREKSLPMSPFVLSQWHASAAAEILTIFERQSKGRDGGGKYRGLLEDRYVRAYIHTYIHTRNIEYRGLLEDGCVRACIHTYT